MRLLRGQGVLEFRILAERDRQLRDDRGCEPGYREPLSKYTEQTQDLRTTPPAQRQLQWFKIGKPEEFKAQGIEADYLRHQSTSWRMRLRDGAAARREVGPHPRDPDRDQRGRWSVSFTLDVAAASASRRSPRPT